MLTIFIIECVKSGKKYYGCSKIEDPANKKYYNPINYMLRQEGKFELLRESVKEFGFKKHHCRLIIPPQGEEMSDYDKQIAVYNKILALKDAGLSLNDMAISPEREKCPDCGSVVRLHFMEVHQREYCSAVLGKSDLDELRNV